MKLPVDEEYDHPNIMNIIEPLKATIWTTASFFHGEPHHQTKRNSHDPARHTGAGGEVDKQEFEDHASDVAAGGLSDGEEREVHHVSANVNGCKHNDRPCDRFVECDVLVERDDVVQRRLAKERNEVTANGQQNKNHIDVENKCSRSGDY